MIKADGKIDGAKNRAILEENPLYGAIDNDPNSDLKRLADGTENCGVFKGL